MGRESSRAAPCLIPVDAASALAWARGRRCDKDLALRARLAPEAVFAHNLPPHTLPEAVRQLAALYEAGCRLMVGRTHNPHWWRILQAHGAVCTFVENEYDLRYAAGPEALERFTSRLRRLSATPWPRENE